MSRSATLAMVAALLTTFGALPGTAQAADTKVESVLSTDGLYRLELAPEDQPLTINRLHRWTITLADADGTRIDGASLTVTGGMPEHNHGLPTAPRVTQRLDDGRYLLEGMRFHMHGAWELRIAIDASAGADTAIVYLEL